MLLINILPGIKIILCYNYNQHGLIIAGWQSGTDGATFDHKEVNSHAGLHNRIPVHRARLEVQFSLGTHLFHDDPYHVLPGLFGGYKRGHFLEARNTLLFWSQCAGMIRIQDIPSDLDSIYI